jgi:putative PEP-CTERM system TPR-repeat lipoprotein
MRPLISAYFTKRLSSTLSKATFLLGIVFFISACGEKTADDHYQDAITFSANGNNEAAIVAYKNALQVSPRMASARYELGRLQLELNQFDSAGTELSRALEFGYAKHKVIPFLAEALQRSGGNVALSELEYRDVTLSLPQKLEVGYRKIQALLVLEKLEEATALVDELILIDASNPYKVMIVAFKQSMNSDYIGALKTLKTEIAVTPLNRDLIAFTARMYMVNDDPISAAKLYEDYIEVAQEDLEAKFSLSNMLIQQRQPEKAEKYIDELLIVNTTNPRLNQLKAVVRASADDFESTQEFAEKAINNGNADLGARLVAGLASFKLNDYESTVKHLTVAASSLPDNHPALRMLAASLLRIDRSEDAGEVLSRVSDITQDDISLFSSVGFELIKAGNTESAKTMIAKAETVTRSADDLAKLGVLKLTIYDIEGVIDLESAVAKMPRSAKVKNTLAGAYLGTSQLDKALTLAQQWQKDEPTNIEAYMLEAEVLQRRGEYRQAAKLIDTAKKIDASSPTVQLASIRLDLREKNYQQGLAKTELFLSQYPDDVAALASYFYVKSQLGDPAPAVAKVENAARSNLNNEPLVLLGARIMLIANRIPETLELLGNIEQNRLSPSAYWEIKGVALTRSNNLADANLHYSEWANFFPNENSPTVGLLSILDSQGEYTKGAKIAADFVKRRDNLQITLMQSYFLAMTSDARGAKLILDKLDSEYQSLPFVRGIRARVALLEGRGRSAVADAEASFSANKRTGNLLVYVKTLDSAGKSNKSFTIIQEHVNEFPNDINNKALLAERLIPRDPVTALKTYEEMLQDFPENPVLLNNASYLYMQANNLEKAFQYSNKAVAILPENIDFSDTLAQIMMRRGQTMQAVDLYNGVVNANVTNEGVILNYIEALLISGDKSVARRKIGEFKSRLKSKQSKARLLILQATYMS